MSFTYNGIELDDLKTLWPVIWPKLSSEASAKIKPFVEKLFTTGNDEQIANWTDVVQSCCEHKPTTFEEYIAYAMIALSIELLPVPSTQFRLEKSRLIAHTFNTFNDFWAHDQKQVLTVAEAIWKVSSNASNINHIVIAIHGYNQFTFNVSMVLLMAALGSLTGKAKSDRLPLTKVDTLFKKLQSLDVVRDPSDKKIMYNFLSLFQSYQRLMSKANDTSLTEMFRFQTAQLDQLEACLKKTTQNLNKTIRDQKDLNDNPVIVHFIELVLNNMGLIRARAY